MVTVYGVVQEILCEIWRERLREILRERLCEILRERPREILSERLATYKRDQHNICHFIIRVIGSTV